MKINMFCIFITNFLLTTSLNVENEEQVCNTKQISCKEENTINSRYLLYDVNPPEGFNLRRDVYIRIAVFTHNLHISKNNVLNKFKLVLPPWINLYHWYDVGNEQYFTWSDFFDLQSLQKFAPVIEMYQFFNEVGSKYQKTKIDEVYVLQHFKDMFETGNFEDRYEIKSCKKDSYINFYNYNNLTSENITCLSFHGYMTQLSNILEDSKARTVMFDHAEIPLHDHYGSIEYWQARRSMRFNKNLYDIANEFRKNNLNSTDEIDNTVRPEDWTKEKPQRDAKGGPYLSVHLRRRDFLWGRPDQVPSIESAAKQIITVLQEQDLKTLFIATDAPINELKLLKVLLSTSGYKIFSFDNANFKLSSGEVAIVDQIICAHAKYFLGTHESTFSFRIQEEREIMGFPAATTFNRLCGDSANCEQPSVWKIVF